MATRQYCDICGCILPSFRGAMSNPALYKVKIKKTIFNLNSKQDVDFDLCPKCMDEIKYYILNKREKEE